MPRLAARAFPARLYAPLQRAEQGIEVLAVDVEHFVPLREHRIEIAFPQLDVNIKELPPRTKAPLPTAEPRASKRRAPRRPRRVLPAGAKGVKPGDKKTTATPDDGDDDENSN